MFDETFSLNLFNLSLASIVVLASPLIFLGRNTSSLRALVAKLSINILFKIAIAAVVILGFFLSRLLIWLVVSMVFGLLVGGYGLNYWIVVTIVTISDLLIWEGVNLTKILKNENLIAKYIFFNFIELFLIFLIPFLIGSALYFIHSNG